MYTRVNMSQPLQVYTVAHAVRRNKITISPPHKKKYKLPSINNHDSIKRKVREMIQEEIPRAKSGQPICHVPPGTVYSKMVSRKRHVEQTNNEPEESMDLSFIRSLKLEPPSWIGKRPPAKRCQTTQLDPIVREMKERCAQLGINTYRGQANSPEQSNYRTSKHHQSFRSNQETDREMPLMWQDEDPLGFQEETPEVTIIRDISPQVSEPKFVFNPVIVNSNKYQDVFSYLGSSHETDTFSIRHSERPRYTDFNDASLYGSPHPNSMALWETSSSYSGSTVAEETVNMRYLASLDQRRVPSPRWSWDETRLYSPQPHY